MPEKKVEKRLCDLEIVKKAVYVNRDGVDQFVKDLQDDRDSCQIPVRLESLDRVYLEFLDAQGEVELMDDEAQLNDHLNERADFEARYCSVKGFLLSKRTVEASQAALNASIHHPPPNPGTFHLRLPQIDLPKINDDISKWLSFRDTYTSMVHSNADIPTVAKHQSLVGEARKPFESVDIDNYAAVCDALLKRESTNELHELVDEFQRHVKVLAKLNEPIVNILSYKHDPAILRAWEEKTSQQDDVKYNDLVEFLYQCVRILKSVASDLLQRSKSVQAKVAGNLPNSKKYIQSKIAANATASDSRSNFLSCFACSEKYFLFQCQAFAKMSVSQRRELVSQRKLCWNCFRTGRQTRSCSSKFTCRTCRDRHHTLLHDSSQFGKSSSTPAVASNSQETTQVPPMLATPGPSTPSQQVSMSVQSHVSMVLLQSVVLQVADDHGHVFQARALLDSTSMLHSMSKNLVNLLSSSQSKVDVSVAGIRQSLRKIKYAVTTSIQSRNGSFATIPQFQVIEHPTADLPTMYPSFSKLRHSVARSLRYLHVLRYRAVIRRCNPASQSKSTRPPTPCQPFNSDELLSAVRAVCRLAQLKNFQKENNNLVACTNVLKTSPLKWLKSYVDEFGLVRVRGCLDNAELPDSTKHPIVLSTKHPLGSILTVHCRKTLHDADPQLKLAIPCQKYWILGGRNLVRRTHLSIPEATFVNIPKNRLNHWERTQRHLQRIWARWYPEYLQQLQSKAVQDCKSPSKIEIGRLVVIKYDFLPPAQWPLGKIIKIDPGKDGIAQLVTLKTASSDNVARPVARIALLPIPNDQSDTTVGDH